jgi:hypothetical protein
MEIESFVGLYLSGRIYSHSETIIETVETVRTFSLHKFVLDSLGTLLSTSASALAQAIELVGIRRCIRNTLAGTLAAIHYNRTTLVRGLLLTNR